MSCKRLLADAHYRPDCLVGADSAPCVKHCAWGRGYNNEDAAQTIETLWWIQKADNKHNPRWTVLLCCAEDATEEISYGLQIKWCLRVEVLPANKWYSLEGWTLHNMLEPNYLDDWKRELRQWLMFLFTGGKAQGNSADPSSEQWQQKSN